MSSPQVCLLPTAFFKDPVQEYRQLRRNLSGDGCGPNGKAILLFGPCLPRQGFLCFRLFIIEYIVA
jgi:hypothetical protein